MVYISASQTSVMKGQVAAARRPPPPTPILLGPVRGPLCITNRQIWPQKTNLTSELLCTQLNKKSPLTGGLGIQTMPNGCESF